MELFRRAWQQPARDTAPKNISISNIQSYSTREKMLYPINTSIRNIACMEINVCLVLAREHKKECFCKSKTSLSEPSSPRE